MQAEKFSNIFSVPVLLTVILRLCQFFDENNLKMKIFFKMKFIFLKNVQIILQKQDANCHPTFAFDFLREV